MPSRRSVGSTCGASAQNSRQSPPAGPGCCERELVPSHAPQQMQSSLLSTEGPHRCYATAWPPAGRAAEHCGPTNWLCSPAQAKDLAYCRSLGTCVRCGLPLLSAQDAGLGSPTPSRGLVTSRLTRASRDTLSPCLSTMTQLQNCDVKCQVLLQCNPSQK